MKQSKVKVGDKVTVSGTKDIYYSLVELVSPSVDELTAGNGAFDYEANAVESNVAAIREIVANAKDEDGQYKFETISSYGKFYKIGGVVLANTDSSISYKWVISDYTTGEIFNLYDSSMEAGTLEKLAEFDISKKQDRADITNLRLVPGTTKLYRSYHPYYAGHDYAPTERVRIEEIQKLIEELGIKSDINLCEDKAPTVGNYYTIYDDNGKNGVTYETTVPDYYQNILDNKNVLYVGDKRFGGNGIIPSADHVYYNSDSDFMIQWIKQILDFINDESNQAPFLMHCEIGVDRTGVFSAIFAGLCGSTWEQIANDYETSNNLCINEFRDANILKYSFERMLKVEDITQEADIKSLLYNYFTSSGYISQRDLDSVVAKITAN